MQQDIHLKGVARIPTATHPLGWVSVALSTPMLFMQGEAPDPAPAVVTALPVPNSSSPKTPPWFTTASGHGQWVGALSRGLRTGDAPAGALQGPDMGSTSAASEARALCKTGGTGTGVSNIQGECWEMKRKEIN